MREYRVVYDNKGYTIEAGQNGWIPSLEIAQKILLHQQKKPFFRDTKLYLEERERMEPLYKENCRDCGGKIIYNEDWLYFDALEIGDWVEEEIIDNFMDMLPPACMKLNCFQIGEPANHKIDENTGDTKPVYGTFKYVAKDIWEYCGNCFRGENVERGKEIPYI